MELTEALVESQPSLTVPWQETILMPIGDIQYGAEGCALDKLKRHIDWGMKVGAYFIGMGDYVDVASPSGREKIRSASFYDSVMDALSEKAHEHMEEVLKVFRGTEGHWLGLHEGHHYWEFDDGGTTDTIMANRLKAPFLGTCAITQVVFHSEPKSKRRLVCQIWSHHGEGSGITMTAPLNKLERQLGSYPTVDIFLLGHYSRMAGYPKDAMIPIFGKNPRLVAKRRILAVCGGFCKGYTVGSRRNGRAQGGYVEKAMMAPTNLGSPAIYIRPFHGEHEDRLFLNITFPEF